MEANPAQYLKQIYTGRKDRNPSYSLGAYARDLGMSISVLSRILSGKRPVSLKLGIQISNVLGLDEDLRTDLLATIMRSLPPTAKVPATLKRQLDFRMERLQQDKGRSQTVFRDSAEFDPISDWYHLAILNLLRLPEFKADPALISQQLNITETEAQEALLRLENLKFIELVNGNWARTAKSFSFQGTNSRASMRNFHTQMIQKALSELSKTDDESFRKRLLSGITLACSQEQIETLKDKTERFQDELLRYLASSEIAPDSLYQFNVQLFSLTNISSKENA